ncbi:MAG: hypothetical protein KAH21_02990 [Spirochaetaceae bacterium]|nr:hypothetical protein [Spirochaetaceae bacterium]
MPRVKHDSASYQILFSELNADISILEDLLEKNRLLTRKIEAIEPDEFDWAALGYTIHNIYNLMENYFLRVAKFFENNIGQEAWHRNLIDRMALDIPEFRPALLQKEALPAIHELRSFRHVFRNIYLGKLSENRLTDVNNSIPETVGIFFESHSKFIGKLKLIASELS